MNTSLRNRRMLSKDACKASVLATASRSIAQSSRELLWKACPLLYKMRWLRSSKRIVKQTISMASAKVETRVCILHLSIPGRHPFVSKIKHCRWLAKKIHSSDVRQR
jgi:hypothetical protein